MQLVCSQHLKADRVASITRLLATDATALRILIPAYAQQAATVRGKTRSMFSRPRLPEPSHRAVTGAIVIGGLMFAFGEGTE